MGGHRIVTCNGTADLTTEGVQDGAAGGIFDDELDQVHGGVGEASGGFDEENGQVLGVIHEVAEDGAGGTGRARLSASRSEMTLDSPGMERGSPWGSRMPRRE